MIKYIFVLGVVCFAVKAADDLSLPSAGCPVGEVQGCGNNCNRKCENYLTNKTSALDCVSLPCGSTPSLNFSCECDTTYNGDGYWYSDALKKCVPAKDCATATNSTNNAGSSDFSLPNTCPAGQIQGCGDNCNRKCENYLTNKTSALDCVSLPCGSTPSLNFSCQCDTTYNGDGYWYNDALRQCVPAKECATAAATNSTNNAGSSDLSLPNTCPAGQIQGCGNNCNRKCENYLTNKTSALDCVLLPCGSTPSLNFSCECDTTYNGDGYWYSDALKKCVAAKECATASTSPTNNSSSDLSLPNNCPAGQILGCGDNCNRKCENYVSKKTSLDCVSLPCGSTPSLNYTCQCDTSYDTDGYWYSDSLKKCVPAKDCPAAL